MRGYSGGRERRDLGAPTPPHQGQGWNALAGIGHQAQHIWRLEVTSSPCRHPSAHVLECVSFTKYSVCQGPVNAWLFVAGMVKDTAGRRCVETHLRTLMSPSTSCTCIRLGQQTRPLRRKKSRFSLGRFTVLHCTDLNKVVPNHTFALTRSDDLLHHFFFFFFFCYPCFVFFTANCKQMDKPRAHINVNAWLKCAAVAC